MAREPHPQEAERAPLWDRIVYGPLLELPWARRLPIMRAVKAGRVVADPRDAPSAVRFARRQARRFLIVTVVCAAVTALTVAELLVDGLRLAEIYGVAGIVCSGTCIVVVRRARRAETQALSVAAGQNEGAGTAT